ICNKMGFIRIARDFFKRCPSKSFVKRLIRKYKEECRKRNKSTICFEDFIMGQAIEGVTESIEGQYFRS
ncbi:hypothetical protein LCGC14_2140720, partial [marine sediment metagenome]